MIPPGVLCLIVGKGLMLGWPGKHVVPMPSRICEIVSDHNTTHVCVDKPCDHVCVIKFPSGETCCMFSWRDLRPITPPAMDAQVLRDKELSA